MILLFELIVITSILVLGYTIATQEKMLLHWIREWADKKHDEGAKWVEPVFLCHWCQPSVWSLFGFLFAYGIGVLDVSAWNSFAWNVLFYYPLVVCGSSIVCGFSWTWYLQKNAAKERDELFNKEFNED